FYPLQNLAADIDGDLFGEIAVRDRDGHVGNVAYLGGEIAGHGVDAVGQIFPSAGDARDQGLTAELAFGADLARDPGDFGGETAQLIDHGVDRVFELKDFAANIDSDLLRQIAVRHRDGHVGNVAPLGG